MWNELMNFGNWQPAARFLFWFGLMGASIMLVYLIDKVKERL